MEFWAGFPILVGESFGQKKNNAIFTDMAYKLFKTNHPLQLLFLFI